MLALAALATFYFINRSSDTLNSEVGDCVQITDSSPTNAKTAKVDCASPDADAVVTEVGDTVNCAATEYQFSRSGQDGRVCMRPNLKDNTCYIVGAKAKNGLTQATDCASPDATIKVLKVLTDTVDRAGCPQGSEATVLDQRRVVYCIAPTG